MFWEYKMLVKDVLKENYWIVNFLENIVKDVMISEKCIYYDYFYLL